MQKRNASNVHKLYSSAYYEPVIYLVCIFPESRGKRLIPNLHQTFHFRSFI
jgi:hypothetical protein